MFSRAQVLNFFFLSCWWCICLGFSTVNHDVSRKVPLYRIMAIESNDARIHSFNPFSSRNKNTHVHWLEADQANFYKFVEGQPRLSAEEELRYGKHISTWRQVQEIRQKIQSKLPHEYELSNAELAEYIGCNATLLDSLSRNADVAMMRLVDCNMKLILAVVSRYRNAAVPNSELIAEGSRGLSRAASRYDYSKGFRFATYATWYVHQAVSYYLKIRQHPAKMPTMYSLMRRQIKALTEESQSRTGAVPTVYELAQALNRPPFDIIKVINMSRYPCLLSSSFSNSRRYPNKLKYEDKERSREEVLPSHGPQPTTLAYERDLEHKMEALLHAHLTSSERDVLRSRLGLGDGRTKAFKEVGQQYDITWREVRCLEKDALSKLRGSDDVSTLVDSKNTPTV